MTKPAIQPTDHADFRYYRRMFNFAFIWNLAHAPRRRIFDFFMRELKPSSAERVVDVGTTNLPEPLENIFELYYPNKSQITAVGTEDCAFLESAYEGLKFVRVKSGEPLPFADNAFDVGFSNAVIEHVGSRANQARFLEELIRVSRRCFLATPNRWFPIEVHTRLPFLHWLPPRLFRALIDALGFDFYAREENLNLLSASDLKGLIPRRRPLSVMFAMNYFLGLPSNLMLAIEKKRRTTIVATGEPFVTLRPAMESDLEDLRVWKNDNRAGFFFHDEITPRMQQEWFKNHCARLHDFMFVVEHQNRKVGCMGFRVEKDGSVDMYNIIAAPGAAGKGLMKAAMAAMCSYAADEFTKDIGCLVLKNNPAVGYYQACGFKIAGDGGDHHVFKLDWTRFAPVAYRISEG